MKQWKSIIQMYECTRIKFTAITNYAVYVPVLYFPCERICNTQGNFCNCFTRLSARIYLSLCTSIVSFFNGSLYACLMTFLFSLIVVQVVLMGYLSPSKWQRLPDITLPTERQRDRETEKQRDGEREISTGFFICWKLGADQTVGLASTHWIWLKYIRLYHDNIIRVLCVMKDNCLLLSLNNLQPSLFKSE